MSADGSRHWSAVKVWSSREYVTEKAQRLAREIASMKYYPDGVTYLTDAERHAIREWVKAKPWKRGAY